MDFFFFPFNLLINLFIFKASQLYICKLSTKKKKNPILIPNSYKKEQRKRKTKNKKEKVKKKEREKGRPSKFCE